MSWYDLEEVYAQADLPEVARRLGMDITRSGGKLLVLCPFHQEKRPSLVLYPREASSPSHFHCFSCNTHGYAVDLIKQVQGSEFKAAVEWLARSQGISPKRTTTSSRAAKMSTREDAFAFALRVFNQHHDESGFVDWCQSRRFDHSVLYGMGLRYLPVGSILVRALQSESFGRQQVLIDGLLSVGLLVRLRSEKAENIQISLNLSEQLRDYFHDGRVLIPIRSAKNDLIGFSGRYLSTAGDGSAVDRVPPKYLLTSGLRKAEVLFNFYQAVQTMSTAIQAGESQPVLYVVEGFFDALRLQALNLPAVAVMGTSLSGAQRKGLIELLEATKMPAGSHLSLRLFFDRDAAGFDGVARACRQLLSLTGIATEWVGFGESENALLGKDPDEILSSLEHAEAKAMLDQHALPAIGVLVAASLGFKDATPLWDSKRWNEVSRYPRERALLQAARAVRALSGASVDWAQRLKSFQGPYPWVIELLELLGARQESDFAARSLGVFEPTILAGQEARLNYARTLAEHGSRRGELPCDEETWRALDRNAQLFNVLAVDRLRQPVWQQVVPCDAVHLPRKLSDDDKVLSDPRRKVMPHPADLHLQQFLMNELLTERHDFSHEGPKTFSDCIPAVRWFATEGELRVTGYVGEGEPSPALHDDERGDNDEAVLSFAYQIDMDVLEGRRKPSDQGMFRPYIECWRGYMASLDRQARAIGPHVHVLRLDAKRYYDSIQRYVVRDQLLVPIEQALTISGPEEFSSLLGLTVSGEKDIAKCLVDLLCGSLFEHGYQQPDDGSSRRSADVIGIPQGPVISAWIGTIAMFPVDAAARAFMNQPDQRNSNDPGRPRVGYARYVDDIVLFADSEARLNAIREVVQASAARLELTLVRKGDAVIPGSPESVMRQLNSGRTLATSVPAWEPPMVGDGETGWGMGDDDEPIDRQSALHLLRHPSLLDEPATVHEMVRDAMRAPDLRPSDLGKCARALWWQVAMQSAGSPASSDKDAWQAFWHAYCQRWEEVCIGHGWAAAFQRRGDDVLFAVEGLDMLIDSNLSMEKGRTQAWIDRHRIALNSLAKALLQTDDVLQGITLTHNGAHIRRRVRKVQWKALQRRPGDIVSASLHADSQQSDQRTLTDWLCQAAILLRRYDTSGVAKAQPLDALSKLSDSPYCQGPADIQAACRYLKVMAGESLAGPTESDGNALRIALPFLVANTTDKSRWLILSRYPDSLVKGLPNKPELKILPPLPVAGVGMLAYMKDSKKPGIRLIAFGSASDDMPPVSAPGAILTDDVAAIIEPIPLHWFSSQALAPGLHRFRGKQPVSLDFDALQPASRARFAADLYAVLYAIQRQDAGDGNEWVTVMAHLAHESIDGRAAEVGECVWYLVSKPVASNLLGVNAWVRDGYGGLRSVSVPGGEYTSLWRLGCAVSDALDMAFDLPSQAGSAEEGEAVLAHPHQIEDYVLRQQLGKLRGTWISDAQVQHKDRDGLPGAVRRSLDILRRFDPAFNVAKQVRLVLHTEAETRSMAMRLQSKGPSDLRDRLHLLPTFVLQRLPLSVLECLPLPCSQGSELLRTDLALLLALAEAMDGDEVENPTDALQNERELGSAQALHIAVALAATGVALRGLVASVWGAARYRGLAAWPESLPVLDGWWQPDTGRQDSQRDYDAMREGLCADDWAGLKEATPWQWMLALLGILDGVAPQTLDEPNSPLKAVYEHLRQWQAARPEEGDDRQWTWPYDGMPPYDAAVWQSLLRVLPSAVLQVDQSLGLVARQVEAPVFRRHRNSNGFTDAESQQWALVKLQYTGLGSADNVARIQRGSRRLATWTEVRRKSDDELLSVHTVDDKLGRWLHDQHQDVSQPAPLQTNDLLAAIQKDDALAGISVSPSTNVDGVQGRAEEAGAPRGSVDSFFVEARESQYDVPEPISQAQPVATLSTPSDMAEALIGAVSADNYRQDRINELHASNCNVDETRRAFRSSRKSSWMDRGNLKSKSHMRVALLQWCVDESYSHPLAEVGLQGMGIKERARVELRNALVGKCAMAEADKAAVRGKEHTWPIADAVSVPSWPEHRRRCLLSRALEACQQLKVDLLVLPEVSVRRETVNWLEDELQRHYPGVAVLAGTYRHFGGSVNDRGDTTASSDVHALMAPLTLLWRPSEELSKVLLIDPSQPPKTFRFWRGKKYRAIAANELFRPDWKELQPLFRVEQLFEQLLQPSEIKPPNLLELKALMIALAEELPPLRYCMELVCSELFLLTSPANIEPLRHEVAAMLKRFPTASRADDAKEMVIGDHQMLGNALSLRQKHLYPRRSVLLVPAATKRSNDYWHAGQASVLASGTATVFCNAAQSAISCGGSCFIGMDSAIKPSSEPAGLIETLTPYHGWRKGILTSRGDGALSNADQALVVVDIDPLHVVAGRPRPQLLPEPMALVAYLPVVELLDANVNKVALYQSLSGELLAQINTITSAQEVQASLATVATASHCPKTVDPNTLWSAFDELLKASKFDGVELDKFVKLFPDSKAVRERLLVWSRDRHQQPHPAHGSMNREPAWLDFLDVDLTLKEGRDLPSITVPPWGPDAGPLAVGE